MIIKAVSLFLIGMVALAMFGKLRLPGLRRTTGKLKPGRVKTCPKCGAPNPGGGRCLCEERK